MKFIFKPLSVVGYIITLTTFASILMVYKPTEAWRILLISTSALSGFSLVCAGVAGFFKEKKTKRELWYSQYSYCFFKS